MDEVLFVIPARSGSSGIKNKNIIDWKGKPLIMHSFDLVSWNDIEKRVLEKRTKLAKWSQLVEDWEVNTANVPPA